jgi:Zinc-binding dehydrogenase
MTGSKKMGIVMWKPNNQEDLAILEELFTAGKVVPVIDRRYPLSEIPEALRYLEGGHAKGKVVITLEPGNNYESNCMDKIRTTGWSSAQRSNKTHPKGE